MYSQLYQSLGYRFRDESLLRLALKHPSSGADNNQRLEFLGDAVLQLCVSDRIYREHPTLREGEMTSIRQKLVCEEALFEIAGRVGLGEYLVMEHGYADAGGRAQPGPLADAMEAVLAAAYLDGGYGAAFGMVERLWEGLPFEETGQDVKGRLQEWTQAHDGTKPVYTVENMTGPVHDRVFEVSCAVDGKVLSRASGKSKKRAEQAAAQAALRLLEGDREQGCDEA